MPRKKYYKNYKKRTYRKRYYNNNEIDPIKGFVALLLLFIFMTYQMFIKDNLSNIILFLQIFVPILIVVIGLIYFYFYKKKKKLEKEIIENTPKKLLELENNIKIFKPLRKYTTETPYQDGLASFLQNNYPHVEIEKSINYKRPDIIIDNIAIEIKGPTSMSELKTIPQKIINYLKERDYLFIVLFDIKITNNPEKSKELYEDWKNDIYETFESKKDKIIFIEM